MRAELSNLTREYDALSREERENEKVGGALAKQINDLTDELKRSRRGNWTLLSKCRGTIKQYP